MKNIKFNGFRRDVEDFFAKSGIRERKKLSHHPFLVFLEDKNEISVEIVDSPRALLEGYPDDTKVAGQWEGRWSSDFFQFTVGEFKKFIKKNPAETYHVV